jgi:hypothetical protein
VHGQTGYWTNHCWKWRGRIAQYEIRLLPINSIPFQPSAGLAAFYNCEIQQNQQTWQIIPSFGIVRLDAIAGVSPQAATMRFMVGICALPPAAIGSR